MRDQRRFASPRASRGRVRSETLISGTAALALFGWFALGACGFDDKPPPPPLPQFIDTSYGDFMVSESPSGISFGAIQCDAQGRYSGGGDASSEDRMRNAMKAAVEKTKKEIDDINRRLDQCKGKSRSDKDFDASFGCDRTKAGAARIRLENKQFELNKLTKDYEETKKSIWVPGGFATKRDWDEKERDRQGYLKQLEAKIPQTQAQIPPLQQDYDALQAKCDQASVAKANDPCSEQNQDAMKNQREALRVQAASHQFRLDKFNTCMDDRKRQAGGQPSGRTTVDPAIIQVLPGVMGGFGSRSGHGGRSSPPPHGHKD